MAVAAFSIGVFVSSHVEASPSSAEACGQIIVVSYAGAAAAASSITRTKPEAKARADALLREAKRGDFAALAKAESDAPSSAPRGGIMGTYAKAEWPELHAALKAPLFKLREGGIAPKPVDAPYGYVILRRCKVEKAHARHLLIRYAGAKNAKPEITRTREQARQLAETVLRGIQSEQDFLAAIAKQSEDSSRDRAGDIGSAGRGRLALAFENTLFALKVGERSGVVETEFGFHIIERLPD
ncbi:MAG TPA: peptidylprolyl isomerase [Polyangiales bacterium]|nr:peptidylprolyl isomerase [Polyangiales bacterium]